MRMHELIDRIGLPAAPDAERLLLGTALRLEGIEVDAWRGAVDVNQFSVEAHRLIWKAILTLREKGEEATSVTVAQVLNDEDKLSAIGGLGLLADLHRDGLPGSSLDGVIRILTEKARLRHAFRILHDAANVCLQPGADVTATIEQAQQALEEMPNGLKSDLQSANEILSGITGDGIGWPWQAKASRSVPIPQKWSKLREIIPHFCGGQLVTIAAHTSVGKSALLLDLGLGVALEGFPVALFSLEMSKEELLQRAACNLGNVDSFDHQNARLNGEEQQRFRSALSRLTEIPLYLDDRSGTTVAAIASAVARMRPKPSLIGVDYLQLLEPSGRAENRVQAVSQISRGLKNLAVRLQIPVIVLSQFNRDPKREGREPDLHDLRDSGSIEQDSNIVIILHSEEVQEMQLFAEVHVIVKKNRNGRKARVVMEFQKPFKHFTEQRRGAIENDAPTRKRISSPETIERGSVGTDSQANFVTRAPNKIPKKKLWAMEDLEVYRCSDRGQSRS